MKLIILFLALSVASVCYGQKTNWQNLDLKKDSTMGISTEQAYQYLLKGKKAVTVVVAVIDAGIDTSHEDLKAVLWHNSREKLNGIDDDKNGHVDDIYGWSFIGSVKGNVHYDNTELVREVRKKQAHFGDRDSTQISTGEKDAFRLFNVQKATLTNEVISARNSLRDIEGFKQTVDHIILAIGKANPILDDFLAYDSKDRTEEHVLSRVVIELQKKSDIVTFKKQLDETIAHYQDELNYHLNVNFDPRNIVGDDYANSRQQDYGCADVTGPEADHGTHVGGIIGAVRTNNLGIKGVADHVLLMSVRTVPNGDERDKDVANAIRYAADNGAKIINMSFGKPYSPEKTVVDEAVKYAMAKDVLLIHAAGNDNKDLDKEDNFPSRIYANNSGSANAWIEVGASSFKNDEDLKASFSNYGQTTVDVFAPGVKINSSVPGNKYKEFDGTSMAAPVVAGLAALIREYYPQLTALQVKEIIMKSVVKIDHQVTLEQKGKKLSVPFSSLCITGGIVNAYNALLLAEHF